MWTDEDRSKERVYLIYIGKKLKEKFNSNLNDATDRWNKISDNYDGDSSVTLYHDNRRIDNECCKYISA